MPDIPGAAGPGAKFPQWVYNTQSHTVSKVGNAGAKAGAIAVTFPAKLIFFTSQAAADAYMTSQGGGADVSNSPATGAANAGAAAAARLPDTASALSAFYDKVTDGKMWRSLGWLVLGVVLIVIGLVLWLGPAAVKASPYGRAFSAVRGA